MQCGLRTALLENDQFEEGIKIAKAARLQALEAVTCLFPTLHNISSPLAITFHAAVSHFQAVKRIIGYNRDILSMRSNCMSVVCCC